MNLYLIEKETERDRGEIFHAVCRGLQELYPGLGPEFDPAFAQNQESTFLLRCAARRLWGKVFFEPLSYAGLESLVAEIELLPKSIQLFIFFPSLVKGITECLAEIPGRPYFFEYCFLRSSKPGQEAERGFALRQWLPVRDEKKVPLARRRVFVQSRNEDPIRHRETYHFYRHARLSREELAELMEIGLDLRKLPAA